MKIRNDFTSIGLTQENKNNIREENTNQIQNNMQNNIIDNQVNIIFDSKTKKIIQEKSSSEENNSGNKVAEENEQLSNSFKNDPSKDKN